MYIQDMQKYDTFVYECEQNQSLKSLLLNDMHFSVRAISNIKNGQYTLSVNSKEKPKDSQIQKGDIIKLVISDDKSDYITQYKDIPILYEDDDIIIFDKPAYIVSHPTKSHLQDTMLNYIQGVFESKNIFSKVRFISRLDRDTSGIITIAKNPFAHYTLSQGFLCKDTKKYYTAIVSGKITPTKGTINSPIDKSEDNIKRIVTQSGQSAITHYEIINQNEDYSMVKLLLETGRTHQIRVHLSHIGHPILGDELYGGDMSLIPRQALHCHKLEIISPRSMKKIVVNSTYPYDMQDIISRCFITKD